MKLSPTAFAFVTHFGEMARNWGLNRTEGQIFALLYSSSHPVSADGIMASLGCSRSNVSMGLKELQGRRLVRLHHVPGDRREYFSAPEDCWQIFRLMAEERKRREIDPTLALLGELARAPAGTAAEGATQMKLAKMQAMMETVAGWFDGLPNLNNEALMRLMERGAGATRAAGD